MTAELERGYFSLLRWRPDVTRDEPRNIGVVLADEAGRVAKLRPIPVSAFSSKLHEQGLLDAVLLSWTRKLEEQAFSIDQMRELSASLSGPLLVTEPKPVAVGDFDATLRALYKAFVAVRTGRGGRAATKGAVLDRVVTSLRKGGWNVRRGAYLDDFIFDVVVDGAPQPGAPRVVSVLSFASPRRDWIAVEKDAGHFLFGRNALNVDALAVVQRPTDSTPGAREPFERVNRWLQDAHVTIADPDAVANAESGILVG